MVASILRSGQRLFSHRHNNILSAAMVLMVAILASRALGLVRDRLLVSTFFGQGQHWQLDVYFAAFRLPDMLFQVIVLGALSAAFIPVYSHNLKTSLKQAHRIANTVITIASLIFILLAVFVFVLARPLSQWLAPNFGTIEISLMVSLTRIMLVAQFFFLVSSFFTGVIQSHQRFLIPALAPVLYNVGIILGIVGLAPTMGIYGPALGVVLGAMLHWVVQLPLARELGYRFRPSLNFHIPGVRKIGWLMIPRTLALAVNQIELTVAVMLATGMSAGSLAVFYFAQNLNALPIGLFGLTIGQAALPMLSKAVDHEQPSGSDLERFKHLLVSSFNYIVYLALPASVLMLVLRVPIVRIALGAKEFPWEATLLTAQVLAVFAVSIVAQSVIQLLVRAFYALQDTRTPLYIGAVSVFVNVMFSYWFTFGLGLEVVGLGWAITIAGLVQAFLLVIFLLNRIHGLRASAILIPCTKMLVASVLTGIALWIPMRLLDQYVLDTTRTIQLIILTLVASGSGFGVYLSFSKLLQIEELDRLLASLNRFGAWQSILSQSEEILTEPATTTESGITE